MLDLRKNKKLGPAFKLACTPAKVGLFFFLKSLDGICVYIYSDNKKKNMYIHRLMEDILKRKKIKPSLEDRHGFKSHKAKIFEML